jgi:hypothetical protein
MHQVFINLYTNTAHAMLEKAGVLEVSLKPIELDGDGKTLDYTTCGDLPPCSLNWHGSE